jgi:hypothetical protein
MPGNKELRVWCILGVVLLGVMLGWILYAQLLWPPGARQRRCCVMGSATRGS